MQGRLPGGIGRVEQSGPVFEDSIDCGHITVLGRVEEFVGPGRAGMARQQGRDDQDKGQLMVRAWQFPPCARL